LNKLRTAHLWLPGYLRDRAGRVFNGIKPKRLWVSINDHYEPLGGGVSFETALQRVQRWQEAWPRIASNAPSDTEGKKPKYTFFYPQEDYQPALMEPLAEMTRAGFGDVEVHIHHDKETPDGFRQKIRTYCRQLRDEHGLLHDVDGRPGFAFIHGNWALDNSLPGGHWCGLTGEMRLLKELNCYADLTMPAIPSPAQGKIVNKIYWCNSRLDKTRSFDRGITASVGGGVQGDILMITGPLGLRYRDRLLPRIETGEIAVYDLPTRYRIKRWLDLAPQIGSDIFIKLYSHGAREDNARALLGTKGRAGGLELMYRWLHEAATERELEVRWASPFEKYIAIERLTRGLDSVSDGVAGVTSGIATGISGR
jgi:hypothetical protein